MKAPLGSFLVLLVALSPAGLDAANANGDKPTTPLYSGGVEVSTSSLPGNGDKSPTPQLCVLDLLDLSIGAGEWKGVTVPGEPQTRADHIFLHALGWHSTTAASTDLLGTLRDWGDLDPQPIAVVENLIGSEGGTVSAPEIAPATELALSIPSGSLSDPVMVTLEILPNPSTDPMAPTVRFTFTGSRKGETPKLITGSTVWPLTLSFDTNYAGEWSDNLVRDVKIVVKRVGDTTWTVLTATVIVANGVATAQMEVTQELIDAGLEVTITTLGKFYQAFHQPEGFLTVTGLYGGTSDLDAALHPEPGQKVLILVHGIFGSAASSWTESEFDFPNSLRDYYDHIIFAQYRSCVKDDWWRSPLQPARKSCSSRAARILWEELLSQLNDGGESLSQATVHLVGHSQGGVVCRWFFQDYPERDATAKDLIEDGLIDTFLSLDSPQGGMTDHQLCSWVGLLFDTGPLCNLLVDLGAEDILGTSFLNRSIDLRGIPTYTVSVTDDIVIPNASALFLTEDESFSVNLEGGPPGPLGHTLAHEEMGNNEVYPNVLEWFGLDGFAGETITIDIPNLPEGARPLRMVRIPRGSFLMGSPSSEQYRDSDEGPQHLVTFNYDFYMGETEVTQAQWYSLMNGWPGGNAPNSYLGGVGINFPVYGVTWNDARSFVSAINRLGQGTFRLHSEAEWEYACRSGTSTRFYFGDSLGCYDYCEDCGAGTLPGNRSNYMWYCWSDGLNGYARGAKEVARLLPNGFGLYDMHGNIWEWCEDWYHPNYIGAPMNGSAWLNPLSSYPYPVLRGGSWDSDAENEFYLFGDCRSAGRIEKYPDSRRAEIGLRVARSVSP